MAEKILCSNSKDEENYFDMDDWSLVQENCSNQNLLLTGVGFLCCGPQEKEPLASDDVITCDTCEATLTSQVLEKHKISCKKKNDLVRNEPDDTLNDLQRLIQMCKKNDTYYCIHCAYRTPIVSRIEKHLLKHKKENSHKLNTRRMSLKKDAVFTCKICKVSLTSQLDLENHKKSCEKNQNVKVDIQMVNGQVDLRRDLEELVWMCKIKSAQYLCKLCRYRTRRKGTIRAHLLKHKRDDLHKSEASEDVLVKTTPMTLKVQNGNKQYKCPITKCEYTSEHHTHLKKHVASCHNEDRPFQCPHCPYRTKDIKYLNSHLVKQEQMHLGIFKYKCRKCPFKTFRPYSFTAHMKSHAIRKPYRCDQCSFLTQQKSYLVRHLKIHTGVKPYACTHCEYKSVYKSDLKRHMMARHKVMMES